MAESPWSWRRGHNPYRETPFQVLALGVDVRGRAAIKSAIATRRRRIEAAPERYPLFGELLTVARVHQAESQIEDPEARLYAELCTHRPRRAPLELDALVARLNALGRPEVPRPAVRLDERRLTRAAPQPPPREFEPLVTW